MKLSQAILVASVSGYTPPKPYRKALAKNDAVSTFRRKKIVLVYGLVIRVIQATCPELNTMDWYRLVFKLSYFLKLANAQNISVSDGL